MSRASSVGDSLGILCLNLPSDRFWAFVSAVAEDVGELHDALKEVSLPPIQFCRSLGMSP